ncbi:acyl-CoA dehydrogenase family protein [Streptomyces sp. NPDC007162]|uniref:acyl-CoA dehydrogenase family protein n=1 Tax=Streptomyces sp. NPDC007162 TaxID=3156917 RepID=UPI0033F811A7
MSVETSDPATRVPTPDPHLTPSEIVAKATQLVPLLRESQADTEKRGRYSPTVHNEIAKAGLYRMLQPRRFGGYESDLVNYVKAMIEISRGDPSAGWHVSVTSGHPVVVAQSYGEQAQEEIFGDGHFVAPMSGAAMGATMEKVDGGYVVNGKFGFASGIPYATHFMGFLPDPTASEPVGLVFVIPKGDGYTMLEDWGDLIGLRGSGSNSVIVNNAFVPDHLIAKSTVLQTIGAGGNQGYRIHGNPLFATPFLVLAALEFGCIQVGAGRAALDEFERIISQRKVMGGMEMPPRFQDKDFQRIYGTALAKIDAANSVVLRVADVIGEAVAAAVEGSDPITPEIELRHYGEMAMVWQLVWEAGELLFRAASSSGSRDGQPMQRYWRDMCAFRSNGIHQFDFRASAAAQAHFEQPIFFF